MVRNIQLAVIFFFMIMSHAIAQNIKISTNTEFINSIGINVHMGYYSTPYGDADKVIDLIAKLGVYHIREGLRPTDKRQKEIWRKFADNGIKVTIISGNPSKSLAAQDIAAMEPAAEILSAIEGPNEYDNNNNSVWVTELRTYLSELHEAAKASPMLRLLPIIGPSFKSPNSPKAVGDISGWVDAIGIHPYAGGGVPDRNLSKNIARTINNVPLGTPIYVTEAGYHNALNASRGQPPVTEEVAGSYIPRLFLDFFLAGISRSFLYELYDVNDNPGLDNNINHWGIVRSNNVPKPAYIRLQTLLQVLADQGNSSLNDKDFAQTIGVNAKNDSDLRSLKLTRSDGTVDLVLWRNVEIWDFKSRTPIPTTTAEVDVTLPKGSQVKVFEVAAGKEPVNLMPTKTQESIDVFAANVGADVVVIRCSPSD